MYNVIDYWSKRPDPNSSDISKFSFDYVVNHIGFGYTVLDFGPGTGRLLAAYTKSSYVEGYDITDRHCQVLYKKSKKLGLDFYFRSSNKIEELPYIDKRFDVAVAVQVLLHQKPENIEFIMSELIRVSCRVIVITWMEKGNNIKNSSHCFNHDYLKICKDNNWRVIDFIKYNRQGLFVYEDINFTNVSKK